MKDYYEVAVRYKDDDNGNMQIARYFFTRNEVLAFMREARKSDDIIRIVVYVGSMRHIWQPGQGWTYKDCNVFNREERNAMRK